MPWYIKSVVEISKPVFLRIRLRADTTAQNDLGKKQKSDQKQSHGRVLVCVLRFKTALIGWWCFDADAASLCIFPITFFCFAFRPDRVGDCWGPLTVAPITILASEPLAMSKVISTARVARLLPLLTNLARHNRNIAMIPPPLCCCMWRRDSSNCLRHWWTTPTSCYEHWCKRKWKKKKQFVMQVNSRTIEPGPCSLLGVLAPALSNKIQLVTLNISL